MWIDHNTRQSGKTTRIVEWAKQNPNRMIIVLDETRRRCLRHLISPDRVVTLREALDGVLEGRCFEEVGIDDADAVLMQMFRRPIGYLTMTLGD